MMGNLRSKACCGPLYDVYLPCHLSLESTICFGFLYNFEPGHYRSKACFPVGMTLHLLKRSCVAYNQSYVSEFEPNLFLISNSKFFR